MTVLENVMEAPIQIVGPEQAGSARRAVKYLAKVGIDERAQGNIRCIFPAVSNSVFLSRGLLAMEPGFTV